MLHTATTCHTITGQGAVKRLEPQGVGHVASSDPGHWQLIALTVQQGWPGPAPSPRALRTPTASTCLFLVAHAGTQERVPDSAPSLSPMGSVALSVPGLAGSLLPPTMQVSSQLVSQGHHWAAMAQSSAASTCSLHTVGYAWPVSDGLHAVREKTGCVTTISFPAVIIEDEEKGSSDYPFNKNFQFCRSSRQTELQL